MSASEFFAETIRGIGQVYLADDLISGCFVLAGIAIYSRIAAAAAFLGSALGATIALATGVPGSMIELGMYGFNASLSVTGMFFFYVPSSGAARLYWVCLQEHGAGIWSAVSRHLQYYSQRERSAPRPTRIEVG
jgi:urea transporter